jgi:hypothetical protein
LHVTKHKNKVLVSIIVGKLIAATKNQRKISVPAGFRQHFVGLEPEHINALISNTAGSMVGAGGGLVMKTNAEENKLIKDNYTTVEMYNLKLMVKKISKGVIIQRSYFILLFNVRKQRKKAEQPLTKFIRLWCGYKEKLMNF